MHPARVVEALAGRGQQVRTSTGDDVDRIIAAVVPPVVYEVLDSLDLTALVRERVDIDELVAAVDVEAIVRRVDIAAIVDRLDIDAIVRSVDIDAIVSKLDIDAIASQLDVDAMVSRVDVDAIVSQVDIDAVARRIDVDAIVERIDIDAIVSRVDIDAIVQRLDLVGLAEEIVNGIDLPEIIRESTGSMASEVVRDVRMQSIDADVAIARFVDRIIRRRRARRTDAPGEPESGSQNLSEPTEAAPIQPLPPQGAEPPKQERGDEHAHRSCTPGQALPGPSRRAGDTRRRRSHRPRHPHHCAGCRGLRISLSSRTPQLHRSDAIAWIGVCRRHAAAHSLSRGVMGNGRTYGDHVMGLRVVNHKGGRLHPLRALARAVFYAIFPIGLLWVLVSGQNRSLQDLVLRTSVIYDWDVRPLPPPPSQAWESRRRRDCSRSQRGRILFCEQPGDREIERSVVRRQSVEHLRSCRCGHTDGAERSIHSLEVPAMGLIDAAVTALFVAEPLLRVGAHGNAHVRSDQRGRMSRLFSSLQDPSTGHRSLAGSIQLSSTPSAIAPPRRHICDRIPATTMRVPTGRSSRRSATACRTTSTGARARPHPDPELRRIQPETGDVGCDCSRLMSVEGKNADAQLEPRRGDGELRQHLQASSRRLVVRPQRVVAESLSEAGQVASNSHVKARADTQPSADRRSCIHARHGTRSLPLTALRRCIRGAGRPSCSLSVRLAGNVTSTLEAGSMFWFARNRLSGS